MEQAVNPFLPLNVCVADGEPKIFGDRVYLFGSHDKAAGDTFCELGYEIWSASVNDLSKWESHGVVYTPQQDPEFSDRKRYLFAPDVVQGKDGRYYIYYSLGGWRGKHGYEGPISVAVCDTPAGKYSYYGYVRNQDGTPFQKRILFDPAVIDDGGVIRLYFGTSYFFDEHKKFPTKTLFQYIESKIFDRKLKEIKSCKDGITGAFTVELADDMLTVVTEPVRIVPNKTKGTPFEGHAFFEAAAISKTGGRYYFVYSSRNNHELCYAVSDYPNKGFRYCGTLVSNGDIGLNGRKKKDRVALTGNNHGNLIKIGDKYYVFYHRMTDKSTYSRQACAEEVQISSDGLIRQTEITSCGLNGKALDVTGEYPAAIACHLTKGKMPHIVNGKKNFKLPYIGYDGNEPCFIKDIENGTKIGYKYFGFGGNTVIKCKLRGSFTGTVNVSDEEHGKTLTQIKVTATEQFSEFRSPEFELKGKKAIYLTFIGKGKADMLSIGFGER